MRRSCLQRLAAMALVLMGALASAQPQPQGAAPTVCPEADEVDAPHLYGDWSAEFGEPQPGLLSERLHLQPHTEFARSVSGSIRRGQSSARVSGDADAGVFTLEESVDGVNISATWSGTIVPDSCGKEIRGTWSDVMHPQTRAFILRKLAAP